MSISSRLSTKRVISSLLLGMAVPSWTACASILGDLEVGPGDADSGSGGAPAIDANRADGENPGDAGGDATSSDVTGSDVTVPDAGEDGGGDSTVTDAPAGDTSLPDTSLPETAPGTDACTGLVADEKNGVFVSPSGIAAGCGSRTTPCKSIQTAIRVASQLAKRFVFVDDGTYVESLTLASNVTVLGGWIDQGGIWARKCDAVNASKVIVKAPPDANTTVTALNVSGAWLDTMTFESKDTASVAPGESIYGIVSSTSGLALTNVFVHVVAGGPGAGGSTGAAGTAGSAAGCTPASDGADGGAGDPGAPGVSSYSTKGFATTPGGTGGVGATGDIGQAGGGGSCVTTGTCEEDPATSQCVSKFPTSGTSNSCGGDGLPGCPGTGSAGGTGGQGGGASIALFVWGGTALVSGGALLASNGGPGGPGGGGGTAGSGVAGAYGQSGPSGTASCVTTCRILAGHEVCTCRGVAGHGPGGTPGTAGGNGGVGGTGGGGVGGDSYSYYAGGGAVVTATSTALKFGTGGTGGAGGKQGPSGAGAAHN